jgi:hypothetical protein
VFTRSGQLYRGSVSRRVRRLRATSPCEWDPPVDEQPSINSSDRLGVALCESRTALLVAQTYRIAWRQLSSMSRITRG